MASAVAAVVYSQLMYRGVIAARLDTVSGGTLQYRVMYRQAAICGAIFCGVFVT